MLDTDSGEPGGAMELPTRLVETHTSVVLLTSTRAYKLRKPVRLGPIDLSTRPARRRACDREVRLNSRLAPDVYLGVVGVRLGAGPDEPAVVMRRLPDERRLSALVTSEVDVRPGLARLARLIADFHAAAERSAAVNAGATPSWLRRLWASDAAEIRPFADVFLDRGTCERVARRAGQFVDDHSGLFRERVRAGFAVDGHGDLLADDIFLLDDGPRVLDCSEFDDRYRFGDVLNDVAFLAMDLERLGRPDLAGTFLAAYTGRSPAAETRRLTHFYIAYRAHVRTKIACIRYAQGEHAVQEQAQRLLAIADAHLAAAGPHATNRGVLRDDHHDRPSAGPRPDRRVPPPSATAARA